MSGKIIALLLLATILCAACTPAPAAEPVVPAHLDIQYQEDPVQPPAADQPYMEFGLSFSGEVLSLGRQQGKFPWSLPLTAQKLRQYNKGNWLERMLYEATCPGLSLYYYSDEGFEVEFLTRIEAASKAYAGGRKIRVGDTLTQLLDAYGDELIYSTWADNGSYFCRFDEIYAYTSTESYQGFIVFFLAREADGVSRVSGICLIENPDGGSFFALDNRINFPLRNGKPDFSQKDAAYDGRLAATLTVYDSYLALSADTPLAPDEAAACRKRLFAHMPQADWWRAPYLFADNDWAYSFFGWLGDFPLHQESELQGLLLPYGRTDGALTDSYSGTLARQFMQHPVALLHLIAAHEDWQYLCGGVSYGSYPRELELHALLGEMQDDTILTQAEQEAVAYTLERMADLYGQGDEAWAEKLP